MTPSLKKRKNKISLLTLEDCVLVKKSKNFLVSVILSCVCLSASTLVFAGNPQNISADSICSRLNLIKARIPFESTENLVTELNALFTTLEKSEELSVCPREKKWLCGDFRSVLEVIYRSKKDDLVQIDKLYEKILSFGESLPFDKSAILLPRAPKPKPVSYLGRTFIINGCNLGKINEI